MTPASRTTGRAAALPRALPSLAARSTHPLGSRSGPVRAGWRWAWLGVLLGALVAVALFAPARWLAAGVAQATQGRLLLVNPHGTVWNGSAGVVFSSGASGAAAVSLPGTLAWQLRPVWGGVTARLDLPCCATSALAFTARPHANGVRLEWRDGQSRWPAAMLAGLGAPWNTLKLDGVLKLSTQSLTIDFNAGRLALSGGATLDAVDLSSSLSTLRPMGSYRVALAGGAQPSLLLSTQDGSSLQLSGSGSWNGRTFRFNGEATAAPGRETALANLLNIIGRRDNARSLITLG